MHCLVSPQSSAICVAFCLLAYTPALGNQDSRTRQLAAAVIRGVVLTDEATPQPLRRALVTLNGPDGRQQTVTDDAGRFVFSRLAEGPYIVEAERPGYVRMAYGSVAFGRPGLPVALAPGDTAEITISLPRGGVITGVVHDPLGRAVPGVTVRLFQSIVREGSRRLDSVPEVGAGQGLVSTQTDSRGEYRLYGLPPGEYLVAAAKVDPSGLLSVSNESTTSPPTFYPSTVFPPLASLVVVGKGEERRNVDIFMTSEPTASVNGMVLGERQVDDVVRVQMSYDSVRGDAPFPFARSVPVGADGRWALSAVPSGRYRITATTSRATVGSMQPPPITRWAQIDLEVVGGNQVDVILTLQPTLTLSGVVKAEDGTPDIDGAQISLVALDSSRVRDFRPVQLTVAGQFRLTSLLPGRYVFVETSDTFSVTSALVNGAAVGDLPFSLDAASEAAGAVVNLTRNQQSISGTLTHRGRRAAGYSIVVFPKDRRYWFPGSPRVHVTLTATDGRYTIWSLPPSSYYLAAFSSFSDDDAADLSLLETVAAYAFSFELAAGEHHTQDFAIP
jgi:hypothetical protein